MHRIWTLKKGLLIHDGFWMNGQNNLQQHPQNIDRTLCILLSCLLTNKKYLHEIIDDIACIKVKTAFRYDIINYIYKIIYISYYWRQRVIMMSTLSSRVASRVVIMTTCGAASDEKVGIVTIPCYQCTQWDHVGWKDLFVYAPSQWETTLQM